MYGVRILKLLTVVLSTYSTWSDRRRLSSTYLKISVFPHFITILSVLGPESLDRRIHYATDTLLDYKSIDNNFRSLSLTVLLFSDPWPLCFPRIPRNTFPLVANVFILYLLMMDARMNMHAFSVCLNSIAVFCC